MTLIPTNQGPLGFLRAFMVWCSFIACVVFPIHAQTTPPLTTFADFNWPPLYQAANFCCDILKERTLIALTSVKPFRDVRSFNDD